MKIGENLKISPFIILRPPSSFPPGGQLSDAIGRSLFIYFLLTVPFSRIWFSCYRHLISRRFYQRNTPLQWWASRRCCPLCCPFQTIRESRPAKK